MKLEQQIKSKEIKDVWLKAYLEVLVTASFFNNSHSKLLKPFKISPQQYNILRILRGSHPKYLHIHSIKERMLEKTPNTTRMIDKLLLHGYIERERGEIDRRRVYVKINEKGLDIMREIDQLHPDFLKMMRRLSEEEARTLSSFLERIRE